MLERKEDIPGVLSIVKAIVFWPNRFPGLEGVINMQLCVRTKEADNYKYIQAENLFESAKGFIKLFGCHISLMTKYLCAILNKDNCWCAPF